MSLSKSKRLIILGVVALLVFLNFTMTGCSQLSDKESTIDKNFSRMLPELNLRYEKLATSIDLAETIGGPRDVVVDGKKHLKTYNEAKTKKDRDTQLSAARELEDIIGRLRANAESSPKLSASAELKALMDEIEKSIPSTSVTEPYMDSVKDFEKARTSWRLFISAVIGGYSAPDQLEFSVKPKT